MSPEPINKNELPHERMIGMDEIKKETLTPEQEIAELEAQLVRKRAELSVGPPVGEASQQEKKNDLKKEEAVLESIIEGQALPSASVSPVAPFPSSVGAADEELSGEEKFRLNQLKKMDKESQLKFLINVSFQKGLAEGVKLVRALNNAYLIDEFHDELVDEFYKKLIEGGTLKEL